MDDEGTVLEARKQVPGRQTTYEECPNLEGNEGIAIADLEATQLVKR